MTLVFATTGPGSMSSQWADGPYSLISTDPFSKDVRYRFSTEVLHPLTRL